MGRKKMTKKSCPYCETVQDVQEIECTEKIEYEGKNIIYKAVHYQCFKCNEVFDSAEMMDKNILSAKNVEEEYNEYNY